jgi:hypothetical protein
MFRASTCPSSGATTTTVAASGLLSELGNNSAVGRGRAGRPDHDQQHCYHQATTVKPEAATAVVVASDDGYEVVVNMSLYGYEVIICHYMDMGMRLWSGRPARPQPTALLPPRSDGKTRGCYCSCCSSWWWLWGCPKHVELCLNDK